MTADATHVLLGYLLAALWQPPLLLAAGALAARLLRPAGPAAQHRVWLVVLALQAVLPACPGVPVPSALVHLLSRGAAGGRGLVDVTLGPVHALGGAGLISPRGALMLGSVYLLLVAVAALRLLRGLWRLRLLRRDAIAVEPNGELAAVWDGCQRRFGLSGAVLGISEQVAGPVTLGSLRPTVLLPPALAEALPPIDLQAALLHECAHIRRRDYAHHLLCRLGTLPLWWHPAVSVALARLAETREMSCDRLAAEALDGGEAQYLRSLLRLLHGQMSRAAAPAPHLIGLFDHNTLPRRLQMLLAPRKPFPPAHQLVAVALCTLTGVLCCTSALALRAATGAPPPPAPAGRFSSAPQVKVSGGVMAGRLASKVQPVYPPEAKKSHIQGAVVLHALIGKDGTIAELTVLSGPPELQDSALTAVHQWVYQPFLLNGEPTEVETTITVNYALAK